MPYTGLLICEMKLIVIILLIYLVVLWDNVSENV